MQLAEVHQDHKTQHSAATAALYSSNLESIIDLFAANSAASQTASRRASAATEWIKQPLSWPVPV